MKAGLTKILTFFALVAVVNGCKEKDDKPTGNNQNQTSKIDLISKPLWKITGLMNGSTDLWNLGLVQACDKDNTYRFKANSILTMYDPPNKCNSGDPDTTNNPWSFVDNESRIYVKIVLDQTIEDTADIVELTSTKMVLDGEYNSIPVRFTLEPQ